VIKSNQARHKKGSPFVKRLRILLLYLNLYINRVTLYQLELKSIYNNLTTYNCINNIICKQDINNIRNIINTNIIQSKYKLISKPNKYDIINKRDKINIQSI
jgi:hypothetical protein